MLGISFGGLSSAGVFTVLIAVGLIPRFAGKTHTSRHVFLYEEMVVAGAIAGCIIAEMLDSIPIFARRISLRHGIGLAVLSMAAGKVAGSVFYFWAELYKVVE